MVSRSFVFMMNSTGFKDTLPFLSASEVLFGTIGVDLSTWLGSRVE